MKNLTKSFSYFFFFVMLGFVACKSSDSVDPAASIIGKWKMTSLTYTPMPLSLTQATLDDYVACLKNVVFEYTANKQITTGKDCSGTSYNEQYDYTISGSTVTDKATGETVDITISGNTFTASSYGKTTKATSKVTYTRL
jgi:hypothetical protein